MEYELIKKIIGAHGNCYKFEYEERKEGKFIIAEAKVIIDTSYKTSQKLIEKLNEKNKSPLTAILKKHDSEKIF